MRTLLACVAALATLAAIHAAAAEGGPGPFSADVVITRPGGVSRARVYADGDRLRLELEGQRRSSVAIARYDRGVVWVLAPSLSAYSEVPLTAWEDHYPNFLAPGVRVERERIGPAVVEGTPAVAWRVRVPREGAPAFEGTLHESAALGGRPLRWKDAHRELVVEWRNASTAPLPPSLFEVPAGYRRVADPAAGGAQRAAPAADRP